MSFHSLQFDQNEKIHVVKELVSSIAKTKPQSKRIAFGNFPPLTSTTFDNKNHELYVWRNHCHYVGNGFVVLNLKTVVPKENVQLPELFDFRLRQRLAHNVGHTLRHHSHIIAAMEAHQPTKLGGRRVCVTVDPDSHAVENRSNQKHPMGY